MVKLLLRVQDASAAMRRFALGFLSPELSAKSFGQFSFAPFSYYYYLRSNF